MADSTLSLWVLLGLFMLVLLGAHLLTGLIWWGLHRAVPGVRRVADKTNRQ